MKQYTQHQIKFFKENFELGQRALKAGLFDRAEKHFLSVTKIAPELMEAQYALAFSYAAGKKHELASVQFKNILKTNPNDAETHHNLANSLYEQKLFSESIEHYKAALKINPNLVDSYIHCAFAKKMLGNLEDTIELLNKALELDAKNIKAFHALGMAYVEVEDYARALRCLENATALAPKNTEIRVSFARGLEVAGMHQEAGLQYHQSCIINPNYYDGFILYANFLMEQRRYDEALECAQRANQILPNDPPTLYVIGNCYLEMGNIDKALERFDAALKIDPNQVISIKGKARLFQESGQLGMATEISKQLINLDPEDPFGYIQKSRVKKSTPDDGLVEALSSLVEGAEGDDKKQSSLHFALGKIYDDQKKYSSAFEHYSLANELRNKHLNYDHDYQIEIFNDIKRIFSSEFYEKLKINGSTSSCPIFIVGMPRSGTTLTEQIISSHPSVQGAGEVIFWGQSPKALALRINSEKTFPECALDLTKDNLNQIASLYESYLHEIIGPTTSVKHITDKMPHNFVHLGLIAAAFPNAKIIHTRRNPIDTCLSVFFQNFNDGHPYAFDLRNLALHYKAYEAMMNHWKSIMPNRIFDINYEDTVNDPEYWSRLLISHVGLEWDDACLTPHQLERSVKTASHWQVRQPIYKTSAERWRKYEQFLEPLIEGLS